MLLVLRSCSVLLVSVGLATAAVAVTPLQTTVTANPASATSGLLSATASGPTATQTVNGSVGVSDVAVSRFDTATGILVGARVAVNTAVSAIARVTGTILPAGIGPTITAATSLTGAVATAGVTIAGTALNASKQCFDVNCAISRDNQQTTTSGSIIGSSAVPLANLAAYAGAGTVGFTRTASGSTTATNSLGVITGTADGLFTFGSAMAANNVYGITYDFINFANPSFVVSSTITDTTLDFGRLRQNSGPVSLNFKLFNIGNSNSAGLDLLSITRQTNDGGFATNLSTFGDGLDAGNSRDYTAIFTPTTKGMATEMFSLVFGDYAVGGIGGKLYRLQIAAKANVVSESMGVPEPASWTMMILGFGLVGAAMRTRARIVAA